MWIGLLFQEEPLAEGWLGQKLVCVPHERQGSGEPLIRMAHPAISRCREKEWPLRTCSFVVLFSPFSPDVQEMRCLGEDSSSTGRAGWGELLGQLCFPFPP